MKRLMTGYAIAAAMCAMAQAPAAAPEGVAPVTTTASDGMTTVTATAGALTPPPVAGATASAGAVATAGATATVNVQVQVPLPPPPPPPPPEPEPPAFEKLRVCVLEFTTIDVNGQIRFLSGTNKKIDVPPQCTLNDADRKSVDSVMQGFVRLVDAIDSSRTQEANRLAQIDDNIFNRAKALDIWNTTVQGGVRPVVIGAEYLESYLGQHPDVFAIRNRDLMVTAMDKLRADPEFPTDFQLKLARASGATHLIYGTVGDLASRENSFTGYGISTKTTNYSLDVIVKVVDLVAQQSAYAKTYTGHYREQRPISGAQFDNNIFQSLMKSALEQAAEDLYEICRPGGETKIRVTPLPEELPPAEAAPAPAAAAPAEIQPVAPAPAAPAQVPVVE